MKMRSLSPSERRTIVLAVFGLGFPLAFIKVIRPFQATLTDTREQLVTERAALAREQAMVATSSQNPALIRVVDSTMSAMKYRLFMERDAADAELSSYLSGVARANHVLVQSATTRPRTLSATGVRTLRVEMRAESDLRGILEFLDALDHGDRLTRIEKLEISRPASVEQTEREALILNATITGYALGDPEPPSSGRGARGRTGGPGVPGVAPARGRIGGGTGQ